MTCFPYPILSSVSTSERHFRGIFYQTGSDVNSAEVNGPNC